MSLVEFELKPLAEIEPWGSAPNLSLHWFGLSYGSYHLEPGASRLLEYASVEGWPRFVEYQLARLHEDLISMLPDVIEVVPSSIVRQFRNGSLGATVQHLRQVWAARVEEDPGLDTAFEALAARALDTGYLSPSAGIWIWSTDGKTIIEWDNRDRLHEGRAVWAAQIGRYELSPEEFLHELRSFDHRLMDAMGSRIRTAIASWTRPDVKVDFKHLEAEQIERGTWLASSVQHGRRDTDWSTVRDVLSRTESRSSA
jgi:hypothetical protein